MTTFDRSDPEGAIAAAAKRVSNWGRWGADDVLGTLNFLDEAKRAQGARLARRGVSFSLAQRFDAEGPQKGWRRRTNPVHTMLSSGLDAEFGPAEFPHGLGGADDVVFMPLQASTQWDGLGHIFDHGTAYNGRRASQVVTSEGDRLTGIETVADRIAGRGVLLDVGRAIGAEGELPDGFAITAEDLEATIAAQGETARVGRGDLLLVRT
ncbi:cyclase family protein, partial [Streptomyces sp. T21Q-yed]